MTSYIRACRTLPGPQQALLAVLAVAVLLANVRQPYPDIAPLQHIPTVFVIVAAPWLLVRFPLSDRSLAMLIAFFLLHTLAGRYTYSNVPYGEWSRWLVGEDLFARFGLVRNEFDRVVHFCFGLLWVGPLAEAARRHAGLGWRSSVMMAFMIVGTVSAVYEIFEWLLTIVVSPDMAADYNGQQGDPWDSQKDMAMAIGGALIASLWAWRRREWGDATDESP